MNKYSCDNWVVIKMKGEDPHYRLLVGTSGGYLTGSSWRLNSGIVEVSESNDYYYFQSASGSEYICSKGAYCLRMNNVGIWGQLEKQYGDKVEMLPEGTDWLKVDWLIKAPAE